VCRGRTKSGRQSGVYLAGETLPGFPYVAALNGAWRLTQLCRPARRIRPA